MQQKGLYLRPLLALIALALIVSACALPGSSTASTTGSSQATQTPKVMPTPHGPVAGQPSGTSKASGGQPLPQNEVKPLVFNLVYNDAAMEQDLAQIYTPGSATYHQFMTNDQIVQRYAVTDAQLQQVETWLTQNGYTIVNIDPLRSGINVQAKVATIEHTMKIQLQSFNLFGHQFFMQQGEPTLPQPVRSLVESVVGLDNFAIPQFKPPFGLSAQRAALVANCKGYGAKQSLTRNKLAAAYQLSSLYQQQIQGQGMTIGVAEFDEPYAPSDIANYAACVGIALPTIQNIDIDGHTAAGAGQGEAAMDLELITGLAPQASILDYQASTKNTSFAQALVDVFNRVAFDHRVQVLSVSYGTGEDSFSASELAAVNRSLRNLAAEGISVFVSSGDCGAFTDRIHNIAVVSFPASAPYAIAVGGTHLQVNNSNVRTSETVWGADDGAPLCQNEWGSGGGVSQNGGFHRPNWQTGYGTTNRFNGTSGNVFTANLVPVSAPNGLRQVPDVSAAAYPNIAIYYQGAWYASGGTSAAAPIWAAGTVLVDQALKQHGKTTLGSVPEFWSLANHPGKFHPYTDIVNGSNLFYPATRGWDYATGWGSPNFNDIAQIELGA